MQATFPMILSMNVETYLAGVLLPRFSDLEGISPVFVVEDMNRHRKPIFRLLKRHKAVKNDGILTFKIHENISGRKY